jgi:hypothetical protein
MTTVAHHQVVDEGTPRSCLCLASSGVDCSERNQVGALHLYHIKRSWLRQLHVPTERLRGVTEVSEGGAPNRLRMHEVEDGAYGARMSGLQPRPRCHAGCALRARVHALVRRRR